MRGKPWQVTMSATMLFAGFVCSLAGASLVTSGVLTAQAPADSQTNLKNRSLKWVPPQVDGPLSSRISSPPCVLSEVVQQAATRANELYTNLESFSAQERIEYQTWDHMGYLQDSRTGTFDYVVLFTLTPEGMTVDESRHPEHGSPLLAAFTQEIGLPEMALLLLPEMQDEYEMSCEGFTNWNGRRTQVVHFVHRKDKPSHTLSFRSSSGTVYPAKLKGRAWIAADSGEVVHMELSLMEAIPQVKVRRWYLSINYAPVQFKTQNVRMLLPQTVDAWCDFEDHRTIAYHTFSDYLLFSVQTDEKTGKPN